MQHLCHGELRIRKPCNRRRESCIGGGHAMGSCAMEVCTMVRALCNREGATQRGGNHAMGREPCDGKGTTQWGGNHAMGSCAMRRLCNGEA